MNGKKSWALATSFFLGVLIFGAWSFNPAAAEKPLSPNGSQTAVSTPTGALIRIVSPFEDQIVPIGQNRIEIAVQNTAGDALHPWQLYLDGNLIATVDKGETVYTLPIGVSGPHLITATLTGSPNTSLDTASVHVTAAPESPSSTPFNLPWVGPVMGFLLIGIVAMLAFGLRMTRQSNGAGGSPKGGSSERSAS